MKTNLKIVVSLSSMLFGLIGCGGGGGGESSGAITVATTTTTTLPVSTIVGVVSPDNYAAGERKNAYSYLNAQRQGCGFGLLQQSASVDVAAQGHSDYLTTNNLYGHYQNQTSHPTGFTGTTPYARLITAGYNSTAHWEVANGPAATYGSTLGQAGIMDLFLAPYHGLAMLTGMRDVGVGYATNLGLLQPNRLTIDFATNTSAQLLGGTDLVTYPCNGSTGVLARSYTNEEPAPIPGRDIGVTPIGHPIYIKVRDGNTLTLSAYDLRVVGTSTPLTLLPLNRSNDTNAIIPDYSWFILMPTAPLTVNTMYFFTATGTNNGAVINISFTFTTGAN